MIWSIYTAQIKYPLLSIIKKEEIRFKNRSSPSIMNAGRKISSVEDTSKEDATITSKYGININNSVR